MTSQIAVFAHRTAAALPCRCDLRFVTRLALVAAAQQPIARQEKVEPTDLAGAQIGDVTLFAKARPLRPGKAATALAVFIGAVVLATVNIAPITACPGHSFSLSSKLGQPFSSSSRGRAPTCLL